MKFWMKKIHLLKNSGFKWFETGKIHVKGYIFDRSDNLYTDSQLLTYFEAIETFSDFEERISYANGLFSVIYEQDGEIFTATDPHRTFPLFYIRRKGEWILSDDPYFLVLQQDHKDMDQLSVTEFLATGYVTGSSTLVDGIRQIQAGEIIRFRKNSLDAHFYYSFRCPTVREDPYQELREEAKTIFAKAFPRFIASLGGRTAVVPLSGGYDSRLVATMLRHYEYDKVICFTYGRKGNSEVDISSRVAEKLGYPWIFAEYNVELIRDFLNKNEFMEYVQGAGKMTSMFPMQEYFAVQYLKEKNLIPPDSIFVPGLFGDFLAGGMLNKNGNLSLNEETDQIAERIYNVKYTFKSPWKKHIPKIKDRIEKCLQEKFIKESDLAYSIQEDYDFKERYAKFITNFTSTYSFFGYEFRLPFCDRELVDFFRKLPLQAKINKYLYDDILTNDYFLPYNINFNHEFRADELVIRRAKQKDRIKALLPEWVKRLFINRKDDLFYREITRYFKEDLTRKGKKIRLYGNSYLSLIIQWYADSAEHFVNLIKRT